MENHNDPNKDRRHGDFGDKNRPVRQHASEYSMSVIRQFARIIIKSRIFPSSRVFPN
ncbi:MAG: hypothetical protein J1E38_09530 [Paramuribaculum sp.]|nr:hypothetical protein [Paramuribaculum sp.]